jgi:hypothetical protein
LTTFAPEIVTQSLRCARDDREPLRAVCRR